MFSLKVKVECSFIPVSVMSDAILEQISNAVKKAANKAATEAATKELSKQVETVYKPWNESFGGQEQKEIKMGNDNYDAYYRSIGISCGTRHFFKGRSDPDIIFCLYFGLLVILYR